MSAISNVCKMINILLKGKKVKINDLAIDLGVNERQVRRYKSELEQYFKIESYTGTDGGYLFKDYSSFYKNVLTEKEMAKLKFLINSFSPEISSDFNEIINKLNFITGNKNDEINNRCQTLVQYSIPSSKIEDMYKLTCDIELSLIESNEILINYIDNKGQVSERRVRPYKILNYKGENYLIAECLLRNEIRNFKFVRIKEHIITNIKFFKSKKNEDEVEEYCNNKFGIFLGKTINIELEIESPMANTIKERTWVENQEIIELEEGFIFYKANMTDSPEVVSWILGMGEAVKIIAPVELKKCVVEKLEKMLKNI